MSDDQDDSQKTEEPTPKKLEDARKKGQVALSREVNNWVMLAAGAFIIIMMGPSMLSSLRDIMRSFIEMSHSIPANTKEDIGAVLELTAKDIFLTLLLPFFVLMAAAFLSAFAQVGPLFSPEAMKPSLDKISPIKGIQRLFSLRSIVEFLKGLLKIAMVSIVGFMLLIPFYGSIEHVVGLEIIQVLDQMRYLLIRLVAGILAVLFFIAALDLIYQRYEHTKKMRMSRQELKDEYKQTEGDPHVKAKLRQLRQQKAQGRMMQAVPEADVVVTNPTHYSVALKYDPEEMDAPVVVAKGIDNIAMRIRDVAEEHDITLYEAPPLARALYANVEIDEMVPTEHYQAVAEVISYVFRIKNKTVPPVQ